MRNTRNPAFGGQSSTNPAYNLRPVNNYVPEPAPVVIPSPAAPVSPPVISSPSTAVSDPAPAVHSSIFGGPATMCGKFSWILAILAFFAILWWLFFICSLAAGAPYSVSISNFPMITSKNTGTQYYWGFNAVFVENTLAPNPYINCQVTGATNLKLECDKCYMHGYDSSIAIAAAVIFSSFMAISSVFRAWSDSIVVKYTAIVSGTVVLVCCIIALASFQDCYTEVSNHEQSVAYGSGFALSIVGFFGVLINVIVGLLLPVGGGTISCTIAM